MTLAGEALLIVDDEEKIRKSLRRLLEKKVKYKIFEAADAEEARRLLKEKDISVAIVDHMMPGMKGTELLGWMKNNRPLTVRIMLTAGTTSDVALEAINKGEVYRFLGKPWNASELVDVVRECVDQHRCIAQLKNEAQSAKASEEACKLMKNHVEEAIQKLEVQSEYFEAHKIAALTSLAEAVDARDTYTHGHQSRVARIASALAKNLGLSITEQETIHMAGLVHDVGKIGIPDNILFRDGPLNNDMWDTMKLHPGLGGKILEPVDYEWKIKDMVLQHHERFDGAGYPKGFRGDRIEFAARILSVADAFDAMNSNRRYRKALPTDVIIEQIKQNKEKQFDPAVAAAMISIAEEGNSIPNWQ